MSFLVEKLSSVSYLASLFPPEDAPTHPICKTTAVPMKILFKDEKLKSKTTEILDRLAVDAQLSGKPEVCVDVHVHKITLHYMYIHVYTTVHNCENRTQTSAVTPGRL